MFGHTLKQHPNLKGVFDPPGVDVGIVEIAAKEFVPFKGSRDQEMLRLACLIVYLTLDL